MKVQRLDTKGIPASTRLGPWPRPRAIDGAPGPRPRLLDGGHLGTMLREGPLNAYLRWALQMRRDFVVWSGATPRVVVIEPDSIRQILAGDGFVRNGRPTKVMFGRGILRIDGEPWRRRRALFQPAFRGPPLTDAIAIVQDEVGELIERWRARGAVAFRPNRELSLCFLRILGRVLFGFQFTEAEHSGRALHRALITIASNAAVRQFAPPLAAALHKPKAVRAAQKHVDALCALVLRESHGAPFIDALRGARDRDELDHATAIDELRTFLIAGHETSATAAAWALTMLAQQPALAESIKAEGAAAAKLTSPSQVSMLTHSVHFVKEVLRLYPTVPLSTSQTTRALRLGRFDLPRATQVDIASFVQQRLPWHWREPARFDPTRFVRAPEFGTYLPFLLGPHTCIGNQLAMLELPLIVARLAANFAFELPRGPPRADFRISLHPGGLEVIAHSSPT